MEVATWKKWLWASTNPGSITAPCKSTYVQSFSPRGSGDWGEIQVIFPSSTKTPPAYMGSDMVRIFPP